MENDTKIYMLSGLGADKRAFKFLNLDFIDSVIHVDKITPTQDEKLDTYCKRLIEKYNIKEKSIVIGLSFGGIIAVEISKQVKLLKTILISSVRNKFDLPFFYTLSGKLGFTKFIPKKSLRKSNYFLEKSFGVANDNERQLLRNIINDTNTDFAKWAMITTANWNETNKNECILRIHGNKDKILPLKNQVDYIIDKGSHLMTVQNATEISEILNKEINNGSV